VALPDKELTKYVKELRDPEIQLQPAGVDLTVRKVMEFKTAGYVGFKDKSIPDVEEIQPRDGIWYLKQGVYKVMFNEIVSVPNDVVGLCFPRSSLLRSGVVFACTVWDPGYVGRGEGLLSVLNPHGFNLEVGARVAQLVFMKLLDKPTKIYSGVYKGENI
jgi:dUTP pyrophosphatase